MQEFGVTSLLPALPLFPSAPPGPSAEALNALSATKAAWVAAWAGVAAAGFGGATFIVAVLAARVWKHELVGRTTHTSLLEAQAEFLKAKLYVADFFRYGRNPTPAPVGVSNSYIDLLKTCELLEKALIPVFPKWSKKEQEVCTEFLAKSRALGALKDQYQAVKLGEPKRAPGSFGETISFYPSLRDENVKARFEAVIAKFSDTSIEEHWLSAAKAFGTVLDNRIKKF